MSPILPLEMKELLSGLADADQGEKRTVWCSGNVLLRSGSTVNPFCYLGQVGYYDNSDLMQNYLRARYYDPGTGLFISRDPIAEADGGLLAVLSPYIYTGSNAVNVTDPSGLFGVSPTPMNIGTPGVGLTNSVLSGTAASTIVGPFSVQQSAMSAAMGGGIMGGMLANGACFKLSVTFNLIITGAVYTGNRFLGPRCAAGVVAVNKALPVPVNITKNSSANICPCNKHCQFGPPLTGKYVLKPGVLPFHISAAFALNLPGLGKAALSLFCCTYDFTVTGTVSWSLSVGQCV